MKKYVLIIIVLLISVFGFLFILPKLYAKFAYRPSRAVAMAFDKEDNLWVLYEGERLDKYHNARGSGVILLTESYQYDVAGLPDFTGKRPAYFLQYDLRKYQK